MDLRRININYSRYVLCIEHLEFGVGELLLDQPNEIVDHAFEGAFAGIAMDHDVAQELQRTVGALPNDGQHVEAVLKGTLLGDLSQPADVVVGSVVVHVE